MRRRRVVLLALATLGMVIAPASALIVETRPEGGIEAGPRAELVVEGHSTAVVFEAASETNRSEMQFAAAVVVLVRERVSARPVLPAFSATTGPGPLPACSATPSAPSVRFPGVTWFNDQYLVRPQMIGLGLDTCFRFPCTGAVLAVPFGLDAELLVASIVNGTSITSLNDAVRYSESFLIPADPNGHSWVVDKFSLPGKEATHNVWTGAILNRLNAPAAFVSKPEGVAQVVNPILNDTYTELGPAAFPYSTPDDGTSDCAPREDRACGVTCLPGDTPPPGYPCPDPDCQEIRYNALLFFDLPVGNATAPRDHRAGSPDLSDAAGCSANATDYRCPSGDDDREGNSHPYGNGTDPLNHGGSADCDGSTSPTLDQYCHATFLVNLTYGVVQREKVPEVRRFGMQKFTRS